MVFPAIQVISSAPSPSITEVIDPVAGVRGAVEAKEQELLCTSAILSSCNDYCKK
jgi:hypothetical protein